LTFVFDYRNTKEKGKKMLKLDDIKKHIKPIELARLLGIPATTVYSWKIIPKWREVAVLDALKKNNIPVSIEDFKG
jgi:hypothetical protein